MKSEEPTFSTPTMKSARARYLNQSCLGDILESDNYSFLSSKRSSIPLGANNGDHSFNLIDGINEVPPSMSENFRTNEVNTSLHKNSPFIDVNRTPEPKRLLFSSRADLSSSLLDTLFRDQSQSSSRLRDSKNHSFSIANDSICDDIKFGRSQSLLIAGIGLEDDNIDCFKDDTTQLNFIQTVKPDLTGSLIERSFSAVQDHHTSFNKTQTLKYEPILLQKVNPSEKSPSRSTYNRLFRKAKYREKSRENKCNKTHAELNKVLKGLANPKFLSSSMIEKENKASNLEDDQSPANLILNRMSSSSIKLGDDKDDPPIHAISTKMPNIKKREKEYEDYFADEAIFRRIISFLPMWELCQMTRVCKRFKSHEFLSAIKKCQCNLIISGLTQAEQYEFWNHHLGFQYLQHTYPLQFSMNAMKVSDFERDIISDIDRTRVFDELSLKKQDSLFKILMALSNGIPKIGYVQGLNTLVAAFLSQKLKDSEVYWLVKYIIKKKRYDEILVDGFPRVQLLNYQLEIYMRNYLPDVIDYLGEKGINISYFTTQWFITFFSYDLELTQLLKLWTLFFIKGWKILVRVALAIIWHFKDDICKVSIDDLPSYLKHFVREGIHKVSEVELFKVALSFKVSNRLLKSLEMLYEHSAPVHVILGTNADQKLDWKILPDNYNPRLLASTPQKDIIEYLNENLESIKVHNKKRGNVSKELDNYRSMHHENVIHRSQTTFQPPRLEQEQKSDSGFLQTLSDFGKKIKNILGPKNDRSNIPCESERKGCRKDMTPLTSSRPSTLIVTAHEGSNYRKSVLSVMREERVKNELNNSVSSTNSSKKDQWATANHFMTPSQFNQSPKPSEEDSFLAPKKSMKHKRTISQTSFLSNTLKKPDCDPFVSFPDSDEINERDESISTNVSIDEAKENKKTLIFNQKEFNFNSKNSYFVKDIPSASQTPKAGTCVKNLDKSFSRVFSELFVKNEMVKPPSKSIQDVPDTDIF